MDGFNSAVMRSRPAFFFVRLLGRHDSGLGVVASYALIDGSFLPVDHDGGAGVGIVMTVYFANLKLRTVGTQRSRYFITV